MNRINDFMSWLMELGSVRAIVLLWFATLLNMSYVCKALLFGNIDPALFVTFVLAVFHGWLAAEYMEARKRKRSPSVYS